jgi:hypothetical protein
MRNNLAKWSVGLAMAAILAVVPAAGQAKEKLEGEAKLAKMLEGRTAGEPVNCISNSMIRDTTVIDNTAIVYRVGSTLYVNKPQNPESLDDDAIMVTRLATNQLCSVDTVQLRDRTMPSFWRGFVALGQFVPYKK